MNKWLKYLVYVSVIFLGWYLWKANILHVPDIQNYGLLAVSLILLFLGYLTKSKTWQVSLQSKSVNIGLRDAVASTGLAELGKYIPGKLWVILGRAGYVSGHYDISTKQASGISLVVQFITIWSGILVALAGIVFIRVSVEWILALSAGWLALTFALFFRPWHNFAEKLLKKIRKKDTKLPFIDIREVSGILHWFFIDWLVRMSGFYVLLLSISNSELSLAIAAGYPLAITLGILAVIAPGGLGVREGILIVWFQAAGFDLGTSTTLAVSSRLWALLGEVGVFVLGMLMQRK